MKEKLTNNIGLKILSVLAAVILWIVVVNVDDPTTTVVYSGIKVTLLNEEAITGRGKIYKIEDESDLISVTVSAKRSVHKKLSAADFTATADMEKDIQYGNLISISVTCSNSSVRQSDIKKSRNNVKISIDDAAEAKYTVVVKQDGMPGAGFIVGSMIPEIKAIRIMGPATLMERVAGVEALVNVEGLTDDDTLDCPLNILDKDGNILDPADFMFENDTDMIAVNVNFLRVKEVGLEGEYTGRPAEGIACSEIYFRPDTVSIAGEDDLLDAIDVLSIPADAIDVTDISEDTSYEIPIAKYLPTGLRLMDETAEGIVTAIASTEAMQTKTIEVSLKNAELTGIADGFSVQFPDTEKVSVTVYCRKKDVASINEENIHLVLDCSAYTRAGSYSVSAIVYVDSDSDAYVKGTVIAGIRLLNGKSGYGNTENPVYAGKAQN